MHTLSARYPRIIRALSTHYPPAAENAAAKNFAAKNALPKNAEQNAFDIAQILSKRVIAESNLRGPTAMQPYDLRLS